MILLFCLLILVVETPKIIIEPRKFVVPFQVGDAFFYEIKGHQLSNDTDLQHKGNMSFIVLMRNSSYIEIKEMKYEIVSGFRDMEPEYVEFHPVSYALIDIHSRELFPFEMSVWHWVDPTSVDPGEAVSIVGESMTLLEKTKWMTASDSRNALHFQANISLIQRGNMFEAFWYDCYYDAEYGFPLQFSTHFRLWEEYSCRTLQEPLSTKIENRTISSSSYSIIFSQTNATFFH